MKVLGAEGEGGVCGLYRQEAVGVAIASRVLARLYVRDQATALLDMCRRCFIATLQGRSALWWCLARHESKREGVPGDE